MENLSETTSFILGAYGDIGPLKNLYFTIMLLWYISICVANSVLILVIYVDRRLHQPMYLLLCNLFVNEISGSTSLYPLMMSQMLSDVHQVGLSWCFLQMCCIYSSASVEFCSLAAMAYDRYVAICYPLHYDVTMSSMRVATIILLIWTYSFFIVMVSLLFFVGVRFCGNVIDKVFCDHQIIIKLSCSSSTLDQLSDLIYAFATIFLPFGLISVSYVKILNVCLRTSRENRQKAISTCTPQLVSISNLFLGCLFQVLDTRLDMTRVPKKVRVMLSVYLLVCQPMITPFMYGFNLPKIRQSCRRFLFGLKPDLLFLTLVQTRGHWV